MSANWVLTTSGFSLHDGDVLEEVPAPDVIKAEFKGILTIMGHVVAERPSDRFDTVKILRFPARLRLDVILPASINGKPYLEIVLTAGDSIHKLGTIPGRDQIVIDNAWMSLVPDELQEANELLAKHRIKYENELTLRQTLGLIQETSPIISVTTSSPDSEEPQVDDDSLSLLSKQLLECGFKILLYTYQLTGVSWMLHVADQGIGFLLADEMGLGKTAQVIAVLMMSHTQGSPTLIVVPATIMENWRREFGKFAPSFNVLVHTGPRRTGFPSKIRNYDVIITSYDIAVRDQSMLATVSWDYLILDEAQAIKNPQTRRSVALKLFKRRLAVAITGTPLENRLLDIWSIMDFANPELLGSRQTFERLFTDNIDDASSLETIISPLMLRRKAIDVATDLPPKVMIPHPVDMSEIEADEYERIRSFMLEQYGEAGAFRSIVKLRQYCSHPFLYNASSLGDPANLSNKYKRFTEIIEDINVGNEKVVVFVSYQKMVDIMLTDLKNRFLRPVFFIDGRTQISERQNVIDSFSLVEGSAFLILNPRAAGVGLNITAANHVIHYNLEWNPAVEDQATARVHRIGQAVPVFVYRLYYPDTIDEVINDKLESKRDLSHAAVVGTDGNILNQAEIARALSISPANRRNLEQD